jgi:hypothetical protein
MPTTQTSPPNEATLLSRVLEPDKPLLPPAAAKAILALDFPAADRDRMRELAGKARAGELSAAEQQEIDTYGRVGALLSILKSKARRALGTTRPTKPS